MILLAGLALAACAGNDGGDDVVGCPQPGVISSCVGADATVSIRGGGTTSQTLHCNENDRDYHAVCDNGCAPARTAGTPTVGDPDPTLLCDTTTYAAVGDACDLTSHPCLPTHATVGPDGTVIGQTYLTCDSGTLKCVAAPAPIVTGYLEACDAATIARYGTTGVNGAVVVDPSTDQACMLAWDAAAGAITSGSTITCVGDWQCPEGALCDDRIAPLANDAAVAVCKPGPRGLLTPAMLTK